MKVPAVNLALFRSASTKDHWLLHIDAYAFRGILSDPMRTLSAISGKVRIADFAAVRASLVNGR